MTPWKNQLYFGNNLKILREEIPDECCELISLDPPFNSNANYNVLFAEKRRKVTHVPPAGRSNPPLSPRTEMYDNERRRKAFRHDTAVGYQAGNGFDLYTVHFGGIDFGLLLRHSSVH